MIERTTTHERLVRSFSSRDLSVEADRRGDADYLIALGLATRMGSQAAGALMRLQTARGQVDYGVARQAVRRLAKQLAARNNWRQSGAHLMLVADLALAHHVFPACQECGGRAFRLIPGTPHLSSTPCQHCHGTGKRPVQRKHHAEITSLIEELERTNSLTEAAVSRRMR